MCSHRVGKFGCIWLEWFARGQGIWRQIFEKCQIPTPCPFSVTRMYFIGNLKITFGLGANWNIKQTTGGCIHWNCWPVWMWALTRPRLSQVLAKNLWNIYVWLFLGKFHHFDKFFLSKDTKILLKCWHYAQCFCHAIILSPCYHAQNYASTMCQSLTTFFCATYHFFISGSVNMFVVRQYKTTKLYSSLPLFLLMLMCIDKFLLWS